MNLKKILLNSIWFGVVPKLGTLIHVLMLPILTPFLTKFDYGIWGIVSSYSDLIMAVATLGLQVHLTNSYFELRDKFRMVWGRIAFLLLILSQIFALVLFVTLLCVLKQLPPHLRVIASLVGICPIAFSSMQVLATHFFQLCARPRPLVLGNLASGLLGLSALFVCVYVFRLGYFGFIANAAVTGIAGCVIFAVLICRREKIRFITDIKRRRIAEWMKISLPMVPHTIGFIFLASSSRIIMDLLRIPIEDIGLYANAYSIGGYITIVTTALLISMVPQIQESYRAGRFAEYRRLFYMSQFIVCIAITLFSIWLPELYRILIRNRDFWQCSELAIFFCSAKMMYPLYTLLAAPATIEKRTPQLLWLIFLPGAINVLLCFAVLPFFGYRGAAYCYLIAFWSQIMVPFIAGFHRRNLEQWFGSRYKLLLLLATCGILVFSNVLISRMSCFFKIPVTLFCIFLFVVIYFKYTHQTFHRSGCRIA